MLRHTLLIDGEFGFASTMDSAGLNPGSFLFIGKISIRKTTQLTFVCDLTPDSYHNAYNEKIGELERQLEQQLMEAGTQKMQEHRKTGLSPDWLRLTIVRCWSKEVEERD